MKQQSIDFSKSKVNEFVKVNSWIYQMDNSKGLDGHSNYSGGMDRPDWIVVVGQNRDSDNMQESNFAAALEMLGGESKNVSIERFGHWGCGWFELLLVNPKSIKSVKIAMQIKQSLNDYPILDQNDYYERENEYQSNYAEGAKKDLAEALAIHFGLKNGRALQRIAFDLNMECQQYYGNDACIDVYSNRKPDTRDIERLKTVLKQLSYSDYKSKSRVFNQLVSKVG